MVYEILKVAKRVNSELGYFTKRGIMLEWRGGTLLGLTVDRALNTLQEDGFIQKTGTAQDGGELITIWRLV